MHVVRKKTSDGIRTAQKFERPVTENKVNLRVSGGLQACNAGIQYETVTVANNAPGTHPRPESCNQAWVVRTVVAAFDFRKAFQNGRFCETQKRQ